MEKFRKIVGEFRKELPLATIATDIICGFPSETDDEFNETMALVEDVKPDIVNVSRFWPRPGTPAARMKQLPDAVVMERSRKLHGMAKSIALGRNLEWVGWNGRVYVSEKGKEPGTFVGRNFAYKPVVLEAGGSMLGRTVEVEVTGAGVAHLTGSIR